MSAIRASAEDAIRVYSLTIAYLHNAILNTADSAGTLCAHEKWAGVLLYLPLQWVCSAKAAHFSFFSSP